MGATIWNESNNNRTTAKATRVTGKYFSSPYTAVNKLENIRMQLSLIDNMDEQFVSNKSATLG